MIDRKSTRLNSSHANISYAVFCLKKKDTDTSARITSAARHRYQPASSTPLRSSGRPSRERSSLVWASSQRTLFFLFFFFFKGAPPPRILLSPPPRPSPN